METNTGLSEGEKHFVANYLRHMYETIEVGDEKKEKIIQDSLDFMNGLPRQIREQIVHEVLPDFLRPIPTETKKV